MNAIEISDLCKSYQDFTLDHLNLALPEGCIMGLVGENGAGKTTTIKLILNMIKKDVLLAEYGLVHGTAEEIARLEQSTATWIADKSNQRDSFDGNTGVI